MLIVLPPPPHTPNIGIFAVSAAIAKHDGCSTHIQRHPRTLTHTRISFSFLIPGLSDQWPWTSIRKMKFSEEQCWRQIQALGFYLAVWASIWQWYCEDWVRVRNIQHKIMAMDIRCLERHNLFYWFTNIRPDTVMAQIKWGQVARVCMGKHTHLKTLEARYCEESIWISNTWECIFTYLCVFLHTSVMLSTFYSKFINIEYWNVYLNMTLCPFCCPDWWS